MASRCNRIRYKFSGIYSSRDVQMGNGTIELGTRTKKYPILFFPGGFLRQDLEIFFDFSTEDMNRKNHDYLQADTLASRTKSAISHGTRVRFSTNNTTATTQCVP